MELERHGFRAHEVVIVGASRDGSTSACALLLRGLGGEIVLIDLGRKCTVGKVMDLSDPPLFATRGESGWGTIGTVALRREDEQASGSGQSHLGEHVRAVSMVRRSLADHQYAGDHK